MIARRDFLCAAGAAAIGVRSGRAAILIRLDGGCSHVDTFDVKPAVSPFREIRTSVPGVRICEHLPRTARLAHKYSIVRSMRSSETNHERAALVGPTPWSAAALDGLRSRTRASGAEEGVRPTRYGATPMGREFFRARMAIERGAKLAVASCGRLRWDTHANNFRRLRDELLPEFDLAFSALLEDLAASGLLATTLVVATGEFGRTPHVNEAGGRDHHAGAWSALMAGAGVPGGRIIGATDGYGYEVTDAPVSPAELLAVLQDGGPAGVLA